MGLFTLLACGDAPKATTTIQPGDPHVLVLILDGVRVEEITSDWPSDITGVTGEEWAEHTWSDVVPDATVVRSILNPVLTSTAPGHAALIMGRPEQLSTVGFQEARGAELYRPQLPTIFEEARTQLDWTENDAVLMANSVVMQASNQSIYPGLEGMGGTWLEIMSSVNPDALETDDTATFDLLKQTIRDAPPPLLYVNVHDADRTGHEGVDAGYQDRVQEQDQQLAKFWRWMHTNAPGYLDGLLMVVTGDHGRHRHDLDGGWTNHGDSCSGCREVPLLLLGDGVTAGRIDDGTYVSLDVAPTLAAHLGIDLPWAQGLPLTGLVDGLTGGRTGEIAVATSGGRVATQVWRDDFTARSEVQVDGEVVSTPGVLSAEAPTLLVGEDRSYVCFRELSSEEEDGYLPWTPRCLTDSGSGWTDIGFPDDAVGPFWQATLFEKDGTLWAGWLHTPLTRGADGSDGVRLAKWTPAGGWTQTGAVDTYFTTTDVVMTPTASGFLVAGALNLPDPQEPYTRRAAVFRFGATGDDLGDETDFTAEDLLDEPRRVERPALSADGSTARVAMLAIGEDRRFVATAESTDGGATWSALKALPTEGEAFVHLTPQWDGGRVVWGALLDDGAAGLCRAAPGDAAAECVSTGSPRLDSFVVRDGVATVSVDTGVGAWEVGQVSW